MIREIEQVIKEFLESKGYDVRTAYIDISEIEGEADMLNLSNLHLFIRARRK